VSFAASHRPAQRLTTRGLHWDLTDAACGFGGMISTSNRLACAPKKDVSQGASATAARAGAADAAATLAHAPEHVVTVTASSPVIWTIGVNFQPTATTM
jgi:hypothetical protein